MPFVEIQGSRVHYATRAGGPQPVVFVHGGFGSSSELWSLAMSGLPESCTGYAIDNFLRSDPPRDGYSVPAFANRLGAFVQALYLQRPVLVGHSMGGVVSQIAAIRFPELVGGLVLTCTGASTTNLDLARRLLADLKARGKDKVAVREISANWFRTPPAGFFDDYVERAVSAPLDAMVAVQESLIETDLRPQLERIKAPTLVVFGRHDTGRTFDHAQTLLDGIAGSRLAIMEESGHSPMVETPDAYSAALADFLRSLTRPGEEHAA